MLWNIIPELYTLYSLIKPVNFMKSTFGRCREKPAKPVKSSLRTFVTRRFKWGCRRRNDHFFWKVYKFKTRNSGSADWMTWMWKKWTGLTLIRFLYRQDTLTPGEQQRLAFARVLYQCPVLAILDESTCSVSIEIEELMYRLLNKVTNNYI